MKKANLLTLAISIFFLMGCGEKEYMRNTVRNGRHKIKDI